MDIVRRKLLFVTIGAYMVKKCQLGRLVCGSQSDAILLMFMEIFVSAFFCGPHCKVLGRQQLCHRFID